MGGGTDRLTDVQVRAFIRKAREGTAATKKLSDGGGLYLTLTPVGTPVWRIKYRHGGKERLFAVGVYPEVTLDGARRQRELVRNDLKEGRDPVQVKRLTKAAAMVSGSNTFTAAAEAWLAKRKREWSAIHYLKTSQALERDVLPALGTLPVADITAPMLARVIEKIIGRDANVSAAKILSSVRGIFELAQVRQGAVIRENPAIAVRAVLTRSNPRRPRPALLAFAPLGDVLRRTELSAISPAVRVCLTLVAYTASRIGNAVEAKWSEFALDSEAPCWTVPRSQMKMQDGRPHDHKVLLGPTITTKLRQWKLMTGGRGFVFPSPHHDNAHVTREALEKVYRVTLGLSGKHSVHGWRASFVTLARDHGFERDAVELSLDHIHDTAVVRAYDRGERLIGRIELMRWWGHQLDRAQSGIQIPPTHKAAVA